MATDCVISRIIGLAGSALGAVGNASAAQGSLVAGNLAKIPVPHPPSEELGWLKAVLGESCSTGVPRLDETGALRNGSFLREL